MERIVGRTATGSWDLKKLIFHEPILLLHFPNIRHYLKEKEKSFSAEKHHRSEETTQPSFP